MPGIETPFPHIPPIFGEICMSESTFAEGFEDIESVIEGFADERHTTGDATLVSIVARPGLVNGLPLIKTILTEMISRHIFYGNPKWFDFR
jgi:hypothetical protein